MSSDRAFRVGLTGGIASGKSTVARLLAARGFRVVDADGLVAELYRPGGAGASAVADLLGPEVLDRTGAVDAAAVARRVFTDAEARRALEAAIHPLVRQRFAELAGDAEGVIVLEATLLVEAGHAPDFDLVVSVEADAETRFARAVERGGDPADARARLAAQGDGSLRRAGAHRLVLNNGTLEGLEAVVDHLADTIRELAAERG